MIEEKISARKIVAVHGSYYSSNFGDTLLIKRLCDEAAIIVGKENVYLARSPKGLDKVDIPYKPLPLHLTGKVTHLLFAGGGYFGEPPGNIFTKTKWAFRNYYRHLSWIRKFKGSKIGIFGVGVGPISNRIYLKKIKLLFNQSTLKFVRDQESYDFCMQHGFETDNLNISVDFALEPNANKAGNRDAIGIHAPSGSLLLLKEILTVLCSWFGDKKAKILFISDNINENNKCRQLFDSFSGFFGLNHNISVDFIPYQECEQFNKVLSILSMLITTKLHAGIVTISQGGLVVAMPAHHKTQRLYKQLGISDYCIPIEDYSRDAFIYALENVDRFKPNYPLVSESILKMKIALYEYFR